MERRRYRGLRGGVLADLERAALPDAHSPADRLGDLYTLGALKATIVHDPGVAADPHWATRRDLPEHARRQYTAIASTPTLGFDLGLLDPRRAAKATLRVPEGLGFGCSYGVVEEVAGERE